MKLGLIARSDNSGLGTLSWEFFRHLPIERTLIVKNGVYQTFPERFPGARIAHRDRITNEDIDYILTGITHLITIETPYEYKIYSEARRRGIKTVLIPMYECMPERIPTEPDLYLCPSELDFRLMPKNKVLLPIPIDRTRIPFRLKEKARTFLHNAGHGGLAGRNGTSELLAAVPMIKSDVKIIINTQRDIDYSHPKVEIRVGNLENYWDLWREGDVFVFPHKFDGLSLPIQEAMSAGMPVLSTAIFPFTNMLPESWLFDPVEVVKARPGFRMIDYAIVSPESIAAKIDEWAGRNITQESLRADTLAQAFDWEHLQDRYLKTFSSI